MKRIAVLTSGGDSPGMNAAIRASVRGALSKDLEVFGIERGYEGLIDGAIKPMDISSVADIIHRGGTMLRTARSKRFMTEEGFQRALSMLDVFKIDGLIVIGGDGSMHGAQKLSEAGIPTMTIPATIDNDMAYTDYTIGFNTAVTTALDAIGKIRDTSSAHERTTVIEVMGRKCGDIAIFAGLAGGAESILIPEREPDMADICRRLLIGKNRGKLHSVIIKAEGVPMSAEAFAKELENRTGQETKAVVLGYLQRGGGPTATDRIMASRMALKAVELLAADSESKAIGMRGDEIIAVGYEEAFNTKKTTHFEYMDMCDILS